MVHLGPVSARVTAGPHTPQTSVVYHDDAFGGLRTVAVSGTRVQKHVLTS